MLMTGPGDDLEVVLGRGDMFTPPMLRPPTMTPPIAPTMTPPIGRGREMTPLQQQRRRDTNRLRMQRHRSNPANAAAVAREREENRQQMRADRARKRAEKTEVAAELLLEKVHDASGSVITANSMRLRTLPDGPERLRAAAAAA